MHNKKKLSCPCSLARRCGYLPSPWSVQEGPAAPGNSPRQLRPLQTLGTLPPPLHACAPWRPDRLHPASAFPSFPDWLEIKTGNRDIAPEPWVSRSRLHPSPYVADCDPEKRSMAICRGWRFPRDSREAHVVPAEEKSAPDGQGPESWLGRRWSRRQTTGNDPSPALFEGAKRRNGRAARTLNVSSTLLLRWPVQPNWAARNSSSLERLPSPSLSSLWSSSKNSFIQPPGTDPAGAINCVPTATAWSFVPGC
jgi:hypothetical protein